VTGITWAEGIAFSWLAAAAGSHLASEPSNAALLAGGAAFLFGGIYLSFFGAVYGILPGPRWLTAPAAWVLLEELRARLLGGAPWALLGQSQHSLTTIAQVAELGGVAALSFLVVMPSAALAARGRERRWGACASLFAVAAALAFGERRVAEWTARDEDRGATATVVAVGGLADDPDPVAAYVAASERAPAAALTIWPESALPGYLQESPESVRRIAAVARSRGWLLLGARHYERAGSARRYRNSALLLAPDGELRAVYTKGRLVPFAERSPWPFPSLVERPYEPGAADPAVLQAGDLRVGALICWESVFAEPAASYARAGVDLLVNLTSDRDLGTGAAQHLAFSRFRAIEARRWLLRASGTGATVAIDPLGRVHPGAVFAIPLGSAPPGLATRAPWLVPGVAALLLAVGSLASARRRSR